MYLNTDINNDKSSRSKKLDIFVQNIFQIRTAHQPIRYEHISVLRK